MQTLCGMDMTAIGDETIEKPEDNPTMKACLGEIDMQNSTNRTGIRGIFLHGFITNNSALHILGHLIVFCKNFI